MTGAAESDVEWLASLGWAVKNTQKQVTLGDQNVSKQEYRGCSIFKRFNEHSQGQFH